MPRCWPRSTRNGGSARGRRTPAPTSCTPRCGRCSARRRCRPVPTTSPGYLRLDFSWGQALSAATRSELEEVANRAVRQDLPVRVLYGSQAEAQAMGAIALFGETYDDTVRIVEIGGPWSVELCGGTHVEHSSQIGPVAITAESSVGSGLRRVEAAVGIEAFHRLAAERTLVSQLAGVAEGAAQRTARPDRGAAGAAAGGREGTVRAARRGAVRVGGHPGRRAPSTSAASRWSRPPRRRAPRPVTCGTWSPTSRASSVAARAWWRSSRRGRDGRLRRCRHASRPSPPAGRRAIWRRRSCRRSQGRGGGKKDMAQGAGTAPGRHPGGHRCAAGGAGRGDAADNLDRCQASCTVALDNDPVSCSGMNSEILPTHRVTAAGKACVWGLTSVRFAWGLR